MWKQWNETVLMCVRVCMWINLDPSTEEKNKMGKSTWALMWCVWCWIYWLWKEKWARGEVMNEHNQRNNEMKWEISDREKWTSSIKMVAIWVELFGGFLCVCVCISSISNSNGARWLLLTNDDWRYTRSVTNFNFSRNFSKFCPLFTIMIKNSVNSFVVFILLFWIFDQGLVPVYLGTIII